MSKSEERLRAQVQGHVEDTRTWLGSGMDDCARRIAVRINRSRLCVALMSREQACDRQFCLASL